MRIRFVLAVLIIGWATRSHGQSPESGFGYPQRILLARQLLDPIRERAVDGVDLRQLYPDFLSSYARVDPIWTASFILDHPPPDDGLLYDHNALLELARQADSIPEDTLLRLIQSGQFMRANVAVLMIQNLPEEKSDIRERLIVAGLTRDTPETKISPWSFEYCLQLAGYSKDAQLLLDVQQQIDEFYRSGQADELRKSVEGQGSQQYLEVLLDRFAPAAHRVSDQSTQPDSYTIEQNILRNDQLALDEKRTALRQLGSYSFGTQLHEKMGAASLLGRVAIFDHEIALQWADTAPDAICKAWARLCIAPSVAKVDASSGSRLIQASYEAFGEFSKEESNYFLSAQPMDVAGNGLRIVHMTNPAMTQECVALTIRMAQKWQHETSQANYFGAIAAVAPYAPAEAKQLFEDAAGDVNLGEAATFFKALLAVSPDQFLHEYDSLPEKDSRGNDPKVEVRRGVLPALLSKRQSDFQYELCMVSYLQLPDGILVD